MMPVVFWVCGAISLLGLVTQLPNGGWRRVLPLLAWLGVTLTVAAVLPTEAERGVALAVAFAGAVWLRSRLKAREEGFEPPTSSSGGRRSIH
jgi:hypothetical protein